MGLSHDKRIEIAAYEFRAMSRVRRGLVLGLPVCVLRCFLRNSSAEPSGSNKSHAVLSRAQHKRLDDALEANDGSLDMDNFYGPARAI